jgi:methanethiol S-methyltransferase
MTRDPAHDVWRLVVALGGGLVFVFSLLFFVRCYVVGFPRPRSGGPITWRPILLNIALFSVFALHHSVFARTGLKAWIKRTLPPELERSFYVWVSSLLFILTCALWQQVPGEAWRVDGWARIPFQLLQAMGAILAVSCARRLGTFWLAGISQVLPPRPEAAQATATPSLDVSGPYALVRHPIYLGWLLFVWATPVMTGTRFVFAAVSSLYLVVAVEFEERDLRATFGATYVDYQRRVRSKMIPFVL